MKRCSVLLCFLLSFFLLGGILPSPKTEAQDSVPAGWTGIYDRAGLESISAAPGGNYILMNDIDLSAGPWQALCSQDAPFTGTLNGNGHTVYGMTVSDSVDGCGLFSYLCGGTVQSLTVSGTSSGPIAGILAGKISRGTVKDCSVSGRVNSSFFGGGIAGQISGSSVTLSGCHSRVTLSGTGSSAGELVLGGICGGVYGTGQVFSDCTFSGELSPQGPVVNAGGIAGLLEGGADGVITVLESHSQGTLSLSYTESACVGGIAGRIGNGTVTLSRCTFTGDWRDSDCRGVLSLGGIAGRAESAGQIVVTQCSSSGSLTGVSHSDFSYSDGYRCTGCSALLGSVGTSNGGTVAVQRDLEVDYSAYVGGIVGASIANGGTVKVSQCSSSVFLTGSGAPLMMGGIVGMNRADAGTALIEDCFSGGRITDSSPVHGEIASAHGGIAGFHGGTGRAELTRCFSSCELQVDYPLADGAIAGIVSAFYGDSIASPDPNAVSVNACYTWTGVRDAYGIPLTGTQVSDPSSYEEFDFLSVWKMDSGSGTPRPQSSALAEASALPGDVDGNGRITRHDGVLLARYLTGNSPLTEAQRQRADLNGDGALNSLDTALILRRAS